MLPAGGKKTMQIIYFPMSCRIFHPGYIKCLKYLKKRGKIIVGLITKKGLKGYKEELISFKDRKYILENLSIPLKVVAQDSLNPSENIKRYKPTAIASGDGWEDVELKAIKKYKLKKINIRLPKSHSSSNIIKRAIKIHL